MHFLQQQTIVLCKFGLQTWIRSLQALTSSDMLWQVSHPIQKDNLKKK